VNRVFNGEGYLRVTVENPVPMSSQNWFSWSSVEGGVLSFQNVFHIW